MSELRRSYAEAGFAARLGAGARPAVLVVDLVRAYLDPDSPFFADGEAARASTERLVDAARGAGHPVIFTTVRYGPGGADGGLFVQKVPTLLLYADPDDPLGDFPDAPRPRDDELVVVKQYASAFFGTTLASTLQARGIDTLVIAGYSTSGCVRASATASRTGTRACTRPTCSTSTRSTPTSSARPRPCECCIGRPGSDRRLRSRRPVDERPGMPPARPSLLLVSDLHYPAQGRRYGDEDVWLSGALREHFDLALCSPLDAAALLGGFDLVLVRNSGPVIHHRAASDAFRTEVARRGTRLVNPLDARGDMQGKGYLVALWAAGEPVIPTVDRRADLDRLPGAGPFVVKPMFGADSIGLEVLESLDGVAFDDVIVQPWVDVVHEISFVFVGRRFQYALYALDRARRWELAPYEPTDDDLAFAQRFVDWNTLDVGVQRVDACRTRDGELLLVELEDLNPYLSLDLVGTPTRDAFTSALVATLRDALDRFPPPHGGVAPRSG